MLVECTRAFMDLKERKLREEGERFEATADRLAELNNSKYGQLVKAVPQEQKPRRNTRKKAEE